MIFWMNFYGYWDISRAESKNFNWLWWNVCSFNGVYSLKRIRVAQWKLENEVLGDKLRLWLFLYLQYYHQNASYQVNIWLAFVTMFLFPVFIIYAQIFRQFIQNKKRSIKYHLFLKYSPIVVKVWGYNTVTMY